MNDSAFNIVTSIIFLVAVLFNGFVVYRISCCTPLVKHRTIIIDNRCKTPIQGVCDLGEDDWKEIKAETV